MLEGRKRNSIEACWNRWVAIEWIQVMDGGGRPRMVHVSNTRVFVRNRARLAVIHLIFHVHQAAADDIVRGLLCSSLLRPRLQEINTQYRERFADLHAYQENRSTMSFMAGLKENHQSPSSTSNLNLRPRRSGSTLSYRTSKSLSPPLFRTIRWLHTKNTNVSWSKPDKASRITLMTKC